MQTILLNFRPHYGIQFTVSIGPIRFNATLNENNFARHFPQNEHGVAS